MQREERELDGEGQEEAAEQPELGLGSKLRPQQLVQTEGGNAGLPGMDQVQCDNRQEHQQRSEHGKEEELDR